MRVPFCGEFLTKQAYPDHQTAVEAIGKAIADDFHREGVHTLLGLLEVNPIIYDVVSARFVKLPAGRIAPAELKWVISGGCVYEFTLSAHPSKKVAPFAFAEVLQEHT